MSISPFITAAGQDLYIPAVTVDNKHLAFNQFAQYDSVGVGSGTGLSGITSTGPGISLIQSAAPTSLVLKTISATGPVTATNGVNNVDIGLDMTTIGTVKDVTAGAGIAITGVSTVNPTIANNGVISIVPHGDGSIVVNNADPQHPIVQAVVVGAGGGTVTNVSSVNADITVANPTTTPALTFDGVSRLIQGSGITLTPTKGASPADARGNVTISATVAGGSVTNVSSVNADITVANPTTTPALTFDGVSSITAGSNVTISSTKLGGRGVVTINAAGGGGGGGGTVTNVSSANAEITVSNPTTTPVLTLNGVSRLVQGTDIVLTATKGSLPSDARGNVTVTAGPNLITTEKQGYPVRFTNNILEQGGATAATLYRFQSSNAWHGVPWTNQDPNFTPYPSWRGTGFLPDVEPQYSLPATRPFVNFKNTGNVAIVPTLWVGPPSTVPTGTNPITPYLRVNRNGLYMVSYNFVIRNNNNAVRVWACLFVTFDSGTSWLEVSGTSTDHYNSDSEEFGVSSSVLTGLSTAGTYVFAIAVSNYAGAGGNNGETLLGATLASIASPSGNAIKPNRASISFVRVKENFV